MLIYSSAFIKAELEKFYAIYFSDSMLHPPPSLFKFSPYLFQKSHGNIFDLNAFVENQLNFFWKHFELIETEFHQLLKLDNIVEVYRKRHKLTAEQNERIDLHCYCNVLKATEEQGLLKTPYGVGLPALPNTFKGEKFSHLIHFLENQQVGWAFFAAAFLLADVIKTHVDLTEKTNEDIKEYWNKRLHDAISFAEKAAEFDPTIQPSVDMFLLHLKVATEESYPDIKQRINTLFLKPDIETLKYYKRDPLQALLQYKSNLFRIKLPEQPEESNPQENNHNDMQCYFSNG